jgi:hypothetical protein
MTSRPGLMSVSRFLACVWQPYKHGPLATQSPSSSRSIKTVSFLFAFMEVSWSHVYHRDDQMGLDPRPQN